MDEAPTPNSFKEIKNIQKKDDIESSDIYSENSYGLFQIHITKYNGYIEIYCKNILKEQNKKYSNKINSKLLKEIMGEDNIDKAYQIIKDIPPKYVLIEPKDDIIIFSITSLSKKNYFELYEEIDINDALIFIKELRNENIKLKNRLDEMEKKIENMNLNCEYNLFDVEMHKLENIFQQLTNVKNTQFNMHTPLIKKRAELGLINKGLKHILKKTLYL